MLAELVALVGEKVVVAVSTHGGSGPGMQVVGTLRSGGEPPSLPGLAPLAPLLPHDPGRTVLAVGEPPGGTFGQFSVSPQHFEDAEWKEPGVFWIYQGVVVTMVLPWRTMTERGWLVDPPES